MTISSCSGAGPSAWTEQLLTLRPRAVNPRDGRFSVIVRGLLVAVALAAVLGVLAVAGPAVLQPDDRPAVPRVTVTLAAPLPEAAGHRSTPAPTGAVPAPSVLRQAAPPLPVASTPPPPPGRSR